ncbi:MAG: hypothetical protein LWW81_15790 [Rhodocyclales bacterium]|nr:hypothetical protein [Thiomonas sp.]MCE1183748.1 hypothetical protein [Rhodocyclales bacterium]
MISRATLIAALPPAARAMCDDKYIDPAAAFIAWSEGLTMEEARSRARNAARSFGSSWPDHTPALDVHDLREIKHSWGVHVADGLAELEAIEAAASALAAPDAGMRLRLADLREADTASMANEFKLTLRRAQQLKQAAVAAREAGQLDLFCGGEL